MYSTEAMMTLRTTALAASLIILTSSGVVAQDAAGPPASQHGAVAQRVNATDISLEYDRPSARGRDLFGGIVDWDVVWTPGANRATWIEVSTPVVFEGIRVEAGRYGIWLIPKEAAPWEVILVREWDTHHSFFPYEAESVRVDVRPVEAEHMETLAFYFPEVGPYQATVRMHWGSVALPLRIMVPEKAGPEGG